MSMRYAIVEDGIVINIAVADSPLSDNWIHDPSDSCAKGDLWTGESFERPTTNSTLEALQAELIEAATAHRWTVETGGITLPNGVQIKTGTEDQARITSVIANARLAGVESVDFKAANGWITLTLAEVEGIAADIALHVQACFAAERAHHDAIAALPDLESAQAYDVTEGWPT
ncbi:DUF4376 domain-containing protein [Xenophilus sp. Marseille-Q4582]|uniref:DUF4376 domain-containing protein n=1 Tax=Xenophilus sp. Marseille-Q4582 TaxID=2866600 RepID=UPI001CE46657|nr:DUF4376 domain-containing protein [Xenophilus sp. Marseille-Q4582]